MKRRGGVDGKLLAAGLLAVLLVGGLLSRFLGGGSEAVAPVTTVGGDVPVEERLSPTDVAVAWVELSGDAPYLDPDEFAAKAAGYVGPNGKAELATFTKAQKGLVSDLKSVVGDAWWILTPLAVNAPEPGPTRATVKVWSLSVKSAQGVWSPVTAFVVVTVELERVDGAWKVFRSESNIVDAPAAALAPDQYPAADSPSFDGALEGFIPIGVSK